MDEEKKYKFEQDDYSQSANSLFHFMKKPEYLQEILRKRAIIPRYCKEDIKYLNISNDGVPYPEILVLQKCFCDIPLHKITQSFHLEGCGDEFNQLTKAEKKRASENNTHPDFYGQYAIGFSKSWGENHNLQPVHYVNTVSDYVRESAKLISYIMKANNIDDIYADEILSRLTFMKPLRGVMERSFKRDVQNKEGTSDEDDIAVQESNEKEEDTQKAEDILIKFNKNFYDEQEWRYVPAREKLGACEIRSVIANPQTITMKNFINKVLSEERNRALWLDYSYDEIRYIIVPDAIARNNVIETIIGLPGELFLKKADVMLQKHIMISKILVLDEIKKDW